MMGKRKVFGTLDPAVQEGAVATGPSVSDTLREARESIGVELRDVAAMLRIRYPYLQAIESGRFEELPGTAYAVGFLRSYAEYLGLDPESVVTRYKEETTGKTRSQQLYFPTPVPEGRIPGGTVLLVTMVLAGIVYGGWYYLSATDRSMVDLVPTLPDRLVSLLDTLPLGSGSQPPVSADPAPAPVVAAPVVSAPVTTAEAPPAVPPAAGGASAPPAPPPPSVPPVAVAPAPGPAPAPVATPVPAPAPAPVASAPAPASVPAAPTPAMKPSLSPAPAAAIPAAPPAAPPVMAVVPPPPSDEDEAEATTQEPTPLSPGATALANTAPTAPAARAPGEQAGGLPSKVYGSQNQASRVQLRATQDSWIQVRDGNGEIIFTRVLKPGDVYRVPDRSGIRVRTGNAGGLTVVTDGVEGAPLGAVGQVLRDVALDQHAPTLRGSGTH
ncbi:helix-turn-helix domain-containing protein [Azospirillum soli]|uniref:helix-turn-helix domain-containing protein n=1 Tax=Azospirillum soli TaxID=1304799 RepID=UPI001FEA5228|nr:helix-turn-helix domain-containing protein [Azospirillum soli]MBP2314192.1 cytoskeletal protein RodZ [Azospirillum soli]